MTFYLKANTKAYEEDLPVKYDEISTRQRRLVREAYISRQEGLCQYCKNSLKDQPAPKVEGSYIKKVLFPPNFFKHPVHLHHCRKTGWTIGAVHAKCNAYMWQYLGE